MPVYEYVCKGCAHPFEELVFGEEQPGCPRCGSRELDKQFSVFGTHGDALLNDNAPGPGSCGTCGDPRGPGACSLN